MWRMFAKRLGFSPYIQVYAPPPIMLTVTNCLQVQIVLFYLSTVMIRRTSVAYVRCEPIYHPRRRPQTLQTAALRICAVTDKEQPLPFSSVLPIHQT
jgi:hypothetical protein